MARTTQADCFDSLDVGSNWAKFEAKFVKRTDKNGKEIIAVEFVQDCLGCTNYRRCYTT